MSPNTDNKEEREKEKGGGKEVQKRSSLDLNILVLVFSTACQMLFENLPTDEKQSPLNHSLSLTYSHVHTYIHTKKVPILTGAF